MTVTNLVEEVRDGEGGSRRPSLAHDDMDVANCPKIHLSKAKGHSEPDGTAKASQKRQMLEEQILWPRKCVEVRLFVCVWEELLHEFPSKNHLEQRRRPPRRKERRFYRQKQWKSAAGHFPFDYHIAV